MDVAKDHTREVEQHVSAILIGVKDSCGFFKRRGDAVINTRQCWYCAYGRFKLDGADFHQTGLCKFKRKE